jgi:flagellar assembly protein FliH
LSRIIRGEELSGCQAWHEPSVLADGKSASQPLTARQLEEIQKQAREEGFQRGLREGREAGAREFLEHIRHLDQLVQALDKPFTQLDEAVEEQLAQLAMLVAKQLVRRELKTEPDQVIGVVREALAVLPLSARDVRLALHPEDAAMVREALSLEAGAHAITLVDDPVQSRGGCRVIAEASQVDATVESRLNAVIANVLGGLRSSDSVED